MKHLPNGDCTSNCRREGCPNDQYQLAPRLCAYCHEDVASHPEKHMAELAAFLQIKVRELQALIATFTPPEAVNQETK